MYYHIYVAGIYVVQLAFIYNVHCSEVVLSAGSVIFSVGSILAIAFFFSMTITNRVRTNNRLL
jgi:hypothetical protein